MRLRSVPIRAILLVGFVLAGCGRVESSEGLTAWIDAPVDGLTLPPGSLISIQGHAAGPGGVARIEIWVNGDLMIEQADPPTDGGLAHFDHILVLDRPGDWVIQLVPFGPDEAVGVSDDITLHVVAYTPTSTATSTSTATHTPVPATHTPTPTITPSVTPPPPDQEGPPAPAPISPSGNVTLGCVGQVDLVWGSVSDRSGISEYRVRVERQSGDGNWQGVSGSPWSGLSGTSLSVPVSCGWYYRWRVAAVDGLGNVGPASSWATFAVTLT